MVRDEKPHGGVLALQKVAFQAALGLKIIYLQLKSTKGQETSPSTIEGILGERKLTGTWKRLHQEMGPHHFCYMTIIVVGAEEISNNKTTEMWLLNSAIEYKSLYLAHSSLYLHNPTLPLCLHPHRWLWLEKQIHVGSKDSY